VSRLDKTAFRVMMKPLPKPSATLESNAMRSEYDLSDGVRGKHKVNYQCSEGEILQATTSVRKFVPLGWKQQGGRYV
jgi:hypothetical protein